MLNQSEVSYLAFYARLMVNTAPGAKSTAIDIIKKAKNASTNPNFIQYLNNILLYDFTDLFHPDDIERYKEIGKSLES